MHAEHQASKNLRPETCILCAEDNQLLAQVLRRLLDAAGHRMQHARNGREAWEQLAPALDSFELLITDNNMPFVSGIELVERARAAGFKGRIIVYTSGLSPAEKQRYAAGRVDAIVCKTSNPSALLAIVDALLGVKKPCIRQELHIASGDASSLADC